MAGFKCLGEGFIVELKPLGMSVTVLASGSTDTPVLVKFGFNSQTMPMKPMNADQSVAEGLKALQENRSMIIPGKTNRVMNAVIPASFKRTMTAKMFAKVLANSKSTVCRTCWRFAVDGCIDAESHSRPAGVAEFSGMMAAKIRLAVPLNVIHVENQLHRTKPIRGG